MITMLLLIMLLQYWYIPLAAISILIITSMIIQYR